MEFTVSWQDPNTHKKEERVIRLGYLEDEDKLFDKILFGLRLVHGHELRIAIIPKYDDEK